MNQFLKKILIFSSLVFMLSGCGAANPSDSFDRSLTGLQTETYSSSFEFGQWIGKALNDGVVPPADQINKSYDEFIKALEKAVTTIDTLTPADEVKNAEPYKQAARNFFAEELKNVQTGEIAQIKDFLLTKQTLDDTDKAELQQLLQQLQDKETALLETVRAARKTFLEENAQ